MYIYELVCKKSLKGKIYKDLKYKIVSSDNLNFNIYEKNEICQVYIFSTKDINKWFYTLSEIRDKKIKEIIK